jgi:hypothetical protein
MTSQPRRRYPVPAQGSGHKEQNLPYIRSNPRPRLGRAMGHPPRLPDPEAIERQFE